MYELKHTVDERSPCSADLELGDDEEAASAAFFFGDTDTADSLTSPSIGPTPPYHSALPSPRQGVIPDVSIVEQAPMSRSCSHASSACSRSQSSSSLSDVVEVVRGGRSVVWVPVVCIACFWYAWTVLEWANFPINSLWQAMRLWQITTSTYPLYSFLAVFTILAAFLLLDAYRHLRHEAHLVHAFTPAGCSCRLPYLLLLCCLLSMDAIVFLILAPLSDVIREQYFSTSATWLHRVGTIALFYSLMLLWQGMVRYVAMVALPRGSSVAVLFPIQLVEDVWADLIFSSFTPFSPLFFLLAALHACKTLVRDLDLLTSVLVVIPLLRIPRSPPSPLSPPSSPSSPSSPSPYPSPSPSPPLTLRSLLRATSHWRWTFPRRVLRHQNLLTEVVAKVIVVGCFAADSVDGSIGPPLMLIDPTLPFFGLYWEKQQRERLMIIAGLLFLVLQQCGVHVLTMKTLDWVDGDREVDEEEEEQVEGTAGGGEDGGVGEVEKIGKGGVRGGGGGGGGGVSGDEWWLDRHWRFHFLFFACCVLRLLSTVLSIISNVLHQQYQANALMCTEVSWIRGVLS